MSSVLDPQPEPTPAEGDVWEEVYRSAPPQLRGLYAERRQQGIDRYGTPLQRENGRDHMADAIQELADAVVYFQAARKVQLSVQVENLLVKAVAEYDDLQTRRALARMGEAP